MIWFFFLGKRWKVFVCSSPLAVCQKEHMASACPNCLWKGPLETLWRCGDGLAARMSLCWKCKVTKPSFPRHKEVYCCGPQQLALAWLVDTQNSPWGKGESEVDSLDLDLKSWTSLGPFQYSADHPRSSCWECWTCWTLSCRSQKGSSVVSVLPALGRAPASIKPLLFPSIPAVTHFLIQESQRSWLRDVCT